MSPADAAAVRAHLDHVLASELFVNAGRLSRLLRFTVERTLAGEGDQLKEYVLGVEVFDKDSSYDPRLDSIVRVEARRLRGRLAEYYASAGQADPVRIQLRKGTYVPTFVLNDANAAAARGSGPLADEPVRRRSRSRVGGRLLVAGAVILLLGAYALIRSSRNSAGAGVTAVAVLPFATFGEDPALTQHAERIADGVMAELARFPDLGVTSRTSSTQVAPSARPLRDVARSLGAEIVMEGSVRLEGGRLHVLPRLVDARLDRKVWSGEFSGTVPDLSTIEKQIANAAAGAIRRWKHAEGPARSQSPAER